MTNYFIVDLQSIIDHPDIICYAHPDYKLYVDECYFDKDLLAHDVKIPKNTFLHFLKSAKETGTITALCSEKQPIKTLFPHATQLNYINLIHVLKDCYDSVGVNDSEARVQIVTRDERFKAKMITPAQAVAEIKANGGVLNNELKVMSRNMTDEHYVSYAKYSLIFLSILALASINDIQKIIQSDFLRSTALLAMITLAVWGLFILRARRRFWYGALEVIIGIIITGNTVLFSNSQTFSNFDYIKIASSIYIIIRGLDNIEKAIIETKNSYFLSFWKKVF
jgi:hypothetical protein